MTVAIAGEFVTVADAAKELKVSEGRIRQFFHEGRISGQFLGQVILIDKDSFLEFKRKTRHTGRPKKSA